MKSNAENKELGNPPIVGYEELLNAFAMLQYYIRISPHFSTKQVFTEKQREDELQSPKQLQYYYEKTCAVLKKILGAEEISEEISEKKLKLKKLLTELSAEFSNIGLEELSKKPHSIERMIALYVDLYYLKTPEDRITYIKARMVPIQPSYDEVEEMINEHDRHTKKDPFPKETRIEELNDIVAGYRKWVDDEKNRAKEYGETEKTVLAYLDSLDPKPGERFQRLKFLQEWLPEDHWIHKDSKINEIAASELEKAQHRKEDEENTTKEVARLVKKLEYIPNMSNAYNIGRTTKGLLEVLKELDGLTYEKQMEHPFRHFPVYPRYDKFDPPLIFNYKELIETLAIFQYITQICTDYYTHETLTEKQLDELFQRELYQRELVQPSLQLVSHYEHIYRLLKQKEQKGLTAKIKQLSKLFEALDLQELAKKQFNMHGAVKLFIDLHDLLSSGSLEKASQYIKCCMKASTLGYKLDSQTHEAIRKSIDAKNMICFSREKRLQLLDNFLEKYKVPIDKKFDPSSLPGQSLFKFNSSNNTQSAFKPNPSNNTQSTNTPMKSNAENKELDNPPIVGYEELLNAFASLQYYIRISTHSSTKQVFTEKQRDEALQLPGRLQHHYKKICAAIKQALGAEEISEEISEKKLKLKKLLTELSAEFSNIGLEELSKKPHSIERMIALYVDLYYLKTPEDRITYIKARMVPIQPSYDEVEEMINEHDRHTKKESFPKETRIEELNDIVAGYRKWVDDEKSRAKKYGEDEKTVLAYLDPSDPQPGETLKRLKFLQEWLPEDHWIHKDSKINEIAASELEKAQQRKEDEENKTKEIARLVKKLEHIPNMSRAYSLNLDFKTKGLLEVLKELDGLTYEEQMEHPFTSFPVYPPYDKFKPLGVVLDYEELIEALAIFQCTIEFGKQEPTGKTLTEKEIDELFQRELFQSSSELRPSYKHTYRLLKQKELKGLTAKIKQLSEPFKALDLQELVKKQFDIGNAVKLFIDLHDLRSSGSLEKVSQYIKCCVNAPRFGYNPDDVKHEATSTSSSGQKIICFPREKRLQLLDNFLEKYNVPIDKKFDPSSLPHQSLFKFNPPNNTQSKNQGTHNNNNP